jgi:hypothetical protein
MLKKSRFKTMVIPVNYQELLQEIQEDERKQEKQRLENTKYTVSVLNKKLPTDLCLITGTYLHKDFLNTTPLLTKKALSIEDKKINKKNYPCCVVM